METVILLTACINPKGMNFTALQDGKVRLKQYLDALDFYLQNTNYKIVFAENSNYDISSKYTKFIDSGRLEILTFQGNNYDKTLGKGFGEALIIKYAIEKSKVLKNATNIIKITGRLIISNITTLVKYSKTPDCVYCNLVRASSRKHTCYSIFFIAPRSFYQDYLIPDLGKINDSKCYYFEHVLNDNCKQWEKDSKRWKEFFLPIIIKGQSGTNGSLYKFSYTMFVKQFIRWFLHRLGIYIV